MSAEGLTGLTVFDFYPDKPALDKMLGQLRRDGFVRGYEIDMQKKDGAIAPFSLSIRLFRDEGGKSTGSVSVARDLSETRKSMAELSLMNARLTGLVEESDNRNRELTLVNSMAEKLQSCLSGGEAYPLITQHAQALFPARSGALFILDPTNNLMEAVNTWGDSLAGEPVFPPTDCWALRRGRISVGGGPRREMRCGHMPPHYPGDYLCLPLLAQGETLGMLHVLDVADLTGERAELLQTLAVTVGDHISLALANIRLRETLHHQVVHDVLTGLFNRRYLEETLEREIYRSRRKGASLGLIMLDLDNFKHFNDTYGHEAGDHLLQTLGKFLAEPSAPGRRGLPLWRRRICLDPGGSLSGDCLPAGRGNQAGIPEGSGIVSGPGAGKRHVVCGSGHVPGARRHRPGRAPGRRRRHVPGQGPRPQPGGGGRGQGAWRPG